MRKHILVPLLALLLGLGGAAAYYVLLAGAVDGLPIPGSTAAVVLTALCVLAGILFLLLTWRAKGVQGGALYSGASTPRALLLLGSAAALLLAAILDLRTVMDANAAGASLLSCALELIRVALAVPAVVSCTFLAKDAKLGGGRSHNSLTVLFPVLLSWIWVIDVYRSHSTNPVLIQYVFLFFAAIFLLLAAHGRAGFSFGDGKPRFTVLVCLCALFLAPISLVSHFGFSMVFLTVGMTLYAADTLAALLKNVPMPELPAPEIDASSEPETEVSSDE